MRHLNLCITNKCNQDCIHCYVNPNQGDIEDINKDVLVNFIENCVAIGLKSVHIFGGEPFLRHDLIDICNAFINLGLHISIATNGHFLNEDIIKWLKSNNIFLTITLHGLKDIHDRISKNPGSYDRTVANIKLALKNNLHFALTTCINKINAHSYYQLVREMANIGVKNFIILYFSPIGRGIELINEIMTNEEWENFIFEFQKLKMNLPLDIEISFEQSIFHKKYISYFTLRQGWSHVCSCNITTKEMIVIDSNGDVYPCILLLRDRRFLLGNIKSLDLKNLMANFDDKLNNILIIPDTCLECSIFDLCKSGCIAYKGKDNLDFRCNPKLKNYALFCPLFTRELY